MNTRIAVIGTALAILTGFHCSTGKRCDSARIDTLLRSNEQGQLIQAFFLIGECRDTSRLASIFQDAMDPRITHFLHFKGISVYQSKMVALKRISGLAPPVEITYQPDSSILKFYYKWAVDNKLIDKKYGAACSNICYYGWKHRPCLSAGCLHSIRSAGSGQYKIDLIER